MEIIKSLNLNKTPKDVENGSIICAKNMMIDDTGSFLTNEYGVDVAFECPHATEFVVGCIPCNSEIVIFTYERETDISRIYRKSDNDSAVEIPTNWTYSGGKLTGSYAYNYKGELIIAVGESNAITINGEPIRVPLKTWNLDNHNDSLSYNIEEEIPTFDVKYDITSNGSLICGVYTFFIRFQVDEASYTKWFQLTDDVIILNQIQKEAPRHTYLYGNAAVSADISKFTEFTINDNLLSNKAITIDLKFGNNVNYSKFQIGYIIKRNEEVLGRIENTYNLTNTVLSILTNEYSEEIAIDEFLKEPHQFYNVENIINYNNRLYISNYTEYEVEDLQIKYANEIEADLIIKEAIPSTSQTTKQYLDVNFSCILNTFSTFIRQVSFYEENGVKYINNPKKFIEQLMECIAVEGNRMTEVSTIYPTGDEAKAWTSMKLYQSFWLFNKRSSTLADCWFCIYSVDGTPNNYKIKIENNHLIVVTTDGIEFPMFVDSNKYGCNALGTKVYNNTTEYQEFYGKTITFYQWLGDSVASRTLQYNSGSHAVTTTTTFRNETYNNEIDTAFNNNRTLIPGQVYNFYVHYIRPDLSSTNGFRLDCKKHDNTETAKQGFRAYVTDDNKRLFQVPPINNSVGANKTNYHLIFPKFTNIKIPKGYIGCFFTYEDIEKTSYPVCIIRHTTGSCDITNTSFQYNARPIAGNKHIIMDGYYVESNITNKIKHKSKLREPYITVTPNRNENREIIIAKNTSIYKKSTKTLYRLTKNIYGNAGSYVVYNTDDAYMYLPGFWNNEKVIHYDKDLMISPTVSSAMDKDGVSTKYTIAIDNGENYSDQPLNAYSIKQDYNKGAVALTTTEGKTLGVFYNSVLSPDRLTDFLEIHSAYTAKPSKSYLNYSKNSIDVFNNTIYRSNVISDESLVNGFREFEIDNYKNIVENKGKIVNIIGVGLYLIIHTEYSIFVFDRTPKLTAKSQLDIPDTFAIDYQELLPSNEGFGGLMFKEESILSKNGYIWYDKANKIIFKYENGKVETISTNINNLLKAIHVETIRFAEDILTNRLIICIYLVEKDVEGNSLSLTISYNFNTKTFISLHDYTFTNNYRTYNKSYLFDENKDRKRLYLYDENSNSYKNLKNTTTTIYPKYE